MMMTIKWTFSYVVVFLFVLVPVGKTLAFHGDDRVNSVASGNWSDEATWQSEAGDTDIIPSEDSEASIGNDFEVTIDSDVGNIHNLRLGAVPLTTGTLNIVDGGFLIAERGYGGGGGGFVKQQSIDVGNGDLLGVLNISGGELRFDAEDAPFFFGAEFENRGELNMSGGVLSTQSSMWVSRAGHGVVNQTGGTINVGGALIMHEACCGVNIPEEEGGNPEVGGRETLSTSVYNMSGGELNVSEFYIRFGTLGKPTNSEMNLSGGVVTTNALLFANDNGTDLLNMSNVGVLQLTGNILDLSGEILAEEAIEIGHIRGLNLQVEEDGDGMIVIRNPGDPNANGVAEASDIDTLSAVVNAGSNDLSFDLTDDDLVNEDDRVEWVSNVATSFFGDADLNGKVEFGDFVRLSNNFNTEGGWDDGDFDGDGTVAFADFVLQSTNFGQSANAGVSAVPEPSSLLFMTLGLLFCQLRLRGIGRSILDLNMVG